MVKPLTTDGQKRCLCKLVGAYQDAFAAAGVKRAEYQQVEKDWKSCLKRVEQLEEELGQYVDGERTCLVVVRKDVVYSISWVTKSLGGVVRVDRVVAVMDEYGEE